MKCLQYPPSHCFVSCFPSLDQDLQKSFVIRQGYVLEQVPKVDLVHELTLETQQGCTWSFGCLTGCMISRRVFNRPGWPRTEYFDKSNQLNHFICYWQFHMANHNHQAYQSDWVKMAKSMIQTTGPLMGLSLSQHLR